MKPTIIFDIDDTLITNKKRRIYSLTQIAKYKQFKGIPEIQCLQKINPKTAKNEYAIDGILQDCKIPLEHHKPLKKAWIGHFLSHKSFSPQSIGTPIEGAKEAVQYAKSEGYDIIYLTGRIYGEKRQIYKATLNELAANDFPIGDKTELIMKPRLEDNDAIFKQEAIQRIKQTHDVHATFDDNPKNVQIFNQEFPKAINYAVLSNNPCQDFPQNSVCIQNLKDAVIPKIQKKKLHNL